MATIDQNKIRKTSRIIRGFALFIIFMVIFLTVAYWVDPLTTFIRYLGPTLTVENGFLNRLVEEGHMDPSALTAPTKALGLFITAIPLALFCYAIFQVYRVMGYFAEGTYISNATVTALRRMAISLLAYVPVSIATEPVLSMAMTFNNPDGERLLSLSITSSEVIALFIGAFLLLISRAFDIEKDRAEEHASIV